jgi:hypothetical protein
MALTAVSISGASSLFAGGLTGTDLGSSDAQTLKDETTQAVALAEAIRAALAAARNQGVSSFRPASALLSLPEGMTEAQRTELFGARAGHNFDGGALTLKQWSDAASALENWAAGARSTLPPALGGGIQFVNGLWYVNGRCLTLSEVYLANRVNIYAEMDSLLTQSLNSIAANNQLVHTVNEGLKGFSTKLQQWVGSYTNGVNNNPEHATHAAWWLIGDSVRGANADDGTANDAITGTPWTTQWLSFVKWSKNAYGADAIASKFSETSATKANFDLQLNRADALKLRDELQAYVDSKTADNQVAQMRTESIFTTRANLLEGMGAFMKGQQNTAASAARSIAA